MAFGCSASAEVAGRDCKPARRYAPIARLREAARRVRTEIYGDRFVTLSTIVGWVQLHRKWIAIGFAMIAPWIWLVGLDRLLRRTR